MRFLFIILVIFSWPTLANDSETQLQNMAASIRLAEQQSDKIDGISNDLQGEQVILQKNINRYSYETARQLHAYHVMERSPARLSFLLPDKPFLDHYYQLRTQENTKNILSSYLSNYNNQLISLNEKENEIKNYLDEKDNLSLSIQSLLKQIKSSQQTPDSNLQNKIQILQSRHNDLNGFLSALTGIKNLNYMPSKKPTFILPLSGVIEKNDNGIQIKSRNNALVTTPASGRILYADTFKNLGLIVIIDHGHGYISILRGLRETYIEGGYIVNNNDPIGIIGGDEWGKGENSAMLYFDLRYNNDSINPLDQITGL